MERKRRKLSDKMPEGVIMSVAQAKRVCKEKLGRLPKPGREFLIKNTSRFSIWLQNSAGTYHLRVYYK